MCLGAINSPQLLMLSGIGPRSELERHGISCRLDLPGVGANLADHPAVSCGYTIRRKLSITDQLFVPTTSVLRPSRLLQWLLRGSGPLATTGCDFGGFFSTTEEPQVG